MGKLIDLTGQRFGRLTVIEHINNNKQNRAVWLCKCDCGEMVYRIKRHLSINSSCGCANAADLTNQRFGKLIVIERVKTPSGIQSRDAYWRCLCDCGNTRDIASSCLVTKRTVSCGCRRGDVAKSLDHSKFNYKTNPSESLFNSKMREYKYGAQKRGLSFELSIEDCRSLMASNCFYCGCVPLAIRKSNRGEFVYNGIDRVDSSKGYVLDNCVPCCGRCNQAKMSETQSDFKSWIEKVYNHFVKGE